MLYLYILTTRLRCLDAERAQLWKQHFTNAHFGHCETLLMARHEVHSKTLMQRYLKDLFAQWRGVIISYDEGLVGDDVVLAAALWRNIFHADPDIDLRRLEAVVSWMRHRFQALEAVPDLPNDPLCTRVVQQAVRLLMSTAEIDVLQQPIDSTSFTPLAKAVPHEPLSKPLPSAMAESSDGKNQKKT